jgi:hypothetical protein
LHRATTGLIIFATFFFLAFGALGSPIGEELINCQWSEDPRSLATTTEGLDQFLADQRLGLRTGSESYELIGEWSWPSLGILGHYSGAGIAIDYPYLYLANATYSRIYWIDISTVPPSDAHYVTVPHAPWGAGTDNDANLWFGAPSVHYNYEYTANPPVLSWTGEQFFNNPGCEWMADISDNCPGDTVYQLGVGLPSATYSNGIYGYSEPSGTPGRHLGHETWTYISQRGLTYNRDNGTFIVGGWNSGKVWEIAPDDGSPLREFTPSMTQISGLAYQDEFYDGIPKLWIQNNSADDRLQVYRWPVVFADDIAVSSVSHPVIGLVDEGPFEIRGEVANLGTESQRFSTWCEIRYEWNTWTSSSMPGNLGPFKTTEFVYGTFPNGLPLGTALDVRLYADNPGDLDLMNNSASAAFRVVRPCSAYVTDRYPDWGNIFYYHDYETIFAKEMKTTGTEPATMVWLAVNTASRGEAYYPWPDPVYDQILLGCWTDNDLDGKPDGKEPVWADTVVPSDAPWVSVEVPECSFLSTGSIWVGYKNLNPGREGLVVDPYPRQHNDCWYYHPYYEDWKPYSGYSDFHIRGCLEYPPLVSASGLEQLEYQPPTPWIQEEYTATVMSMKLCGHVDGSLSSSNLLHRTLPVMIHKENVSLMPPEFIGDMSDTVEASLIVSVPVGQHEGLYDGTVYVDHAGGTEEIPFSLEVGISSDLDIQDYGGSLQGNVMELMGIRDGIAIGTFNAVNPSSWQVNFDQHDGPGNSDLTGISWSATDLDFFSGSDTSKQMIPSSAVDVIGLAPELSSGQGTYGVVTVNIPSYAKHWQQQFDFGYSGKITMSGIDREGNEVSDEFSIYLMVIKSHEGSGLCFWGERKGSSNVIHWSDLGLSESGYALYRNGEKIADLTGQYEYSDPVFTCAAFDYELGVKVGGSEIQIGPITVSGRPPGEFSLSQNSPNPLKERTSIRYEVAEATDVTIRVYNPAGMLVRTLVDEHKTPGVYTTEWSGVDVGNGIYFCRMNAGDFSMTRKMVVMK